MRVLLFCALVADVVAGQTVTATLMAVTTPNVQGATLTAGSARQGIVYGLDSALFADAYRVSCN